MGSGSASGKWVKLEGGWEFGQRKIEERGVKRNGCQGEC